MKARQRRPRAPKPETLSMDWFTKDFVDKSLQEDPQGCHSNLQEHEEAVKTCAETLRKFGISNPLRFLQRWTTSEILTGLDTIIGLESEDYKIYSLGAWLWSHLARGEGGSLEPADYLGRSAEVVNSIVGQLKLRGFSHPAYLVATYPLEVILEAINAADEIVKRLEVKDVPGLITSVVEGSTGKSMGGEAMSKRDPLTPAEMPVMRLIARGLTNQEISEQLRISEHTLSGRVTSIFSKLGAKNRAHAAALALRRGILTEEDVNGQGNG